MADVNNAPVVLSDVDLHLRVANADFSETVETPYAFTASYIPRSWQPSLAMFAVESPLPTELAVTPTGPEHDLRFTRTWQLLARDPALLSAYNQMRPSVPHRATSSAS
jgi:hypothetical protein